MKNEMDPFKIFENVKLQATPDYLWNRIEAQWQSRSQMSTHLFFKWGWVIVVGAMINLGLGIYVFQQRRSSEKLESVNHYPLTYITYE